MAIASILQPIYEKKKKLEEELGKLAVSRDTNEREANEASERVTDLNGRVGMLEKLIDDLVEGAKAALELLTGIVTRSTSVVNTANTAIETA